MSLRLPNLCRVLLIACLALPNAARAIELVEYYHKDLDHYVITGYAPEIQALDSGEHKGWARTGFSFQSIEGVPGVDAVDVCRFYSPTLDSHFYSASKTECEAVVQKWSSVWQLESTNIFRVAAVDPATGACPSNTQAVHRLYNKRPDVNHRYTTDATVFDAMVAKGYVPEGTGNALRPVVFCAASKTVAQPAGGVPGAVPLCTLTASAEFPAINTPVTLTATCTENPTAFAWTNCVSANATCTDRSSVAGSISYGVVASNSRGTSAAATLALSWQVTASGAPTCTVTASSATPLVGSALTLTGSCSYSPAKYQWLGCSALLIEACNPIAECANGTQQCSLSSARAGSIFYALIASNSVGASQKAGVSVDWRGTAIPTPPSTPTPLPAPVCTITPSQSPPVVGTTLTLTASCSNGPTSFRWTNCTPTQGLPQTCSTTESTPGSRSYRVQGVNATGIGAPSDVTYTWMTSGSAVPNVPTGCSITSVPNNGLLGAGGGPITISAACGGGGAVTSWNWRKNATVGWANGASQNDSLPANSGSSSITTIYGVTACAGNACAAELTTNFTVLAGAPAPTSSCGQYSDVAYVDLPWGGVVDTRTTPGLKPDTMIVARLQVPIGASGQGSMNWSEFVGEPAQRVVSLSTQACDQRGWSPSSYPTDPTSAAAPLSWGIGQTGGVKFGVLGSIGSPALVPGQTYYFNILNRNPSTGGGSCTSSRCDMRLTMALF